VGGAGVQATRHQVTCARLKARGRSRRVPIGYFELIKDGDDLAGLIGRKVDLLTESAISPFMLAAMERVEELTRTRSRPKWPERDTGISV